MTITTQEASDYIGETLFDNDGNKIGKIGALYLDDATGLPEWVTVSTGFFGSNESFVPIAEAGTREGGLAVPFSRDKVKNAPNVDLDGGHLSTDEEATLYRYYGQEYSTSASESGLPTSATGTTGRSDAGDNTFATGTGTSGAPVVTGDDAMTRSEEQLNVGTETVPVGKARLRKWVETEHQSVDVPIRKEKVRLETEPITGDNLGQAYSGQEITEAEHEITLTEERPVVSTEAVPVEQVRLAKETHEETQTVEGDVRKERVALDTDEDAGPRR